MRAPPRTKYMQSLDDREQGRPAASGRDVFTLRQRACSDIANASAERKDRVDEEDTRALRETSKVGRPLACRKKKSSSQFERLARDNSFRRNSGMFESALINVPRPIDFSHCEKAGGKGREEGVRGACGPKDNIARDGGCLKVRFFAA